MSLKDAFDDLPEDIESKDVIELRRALMRTQKQLSDTKKKKDDFTAAVVQAAHDAMLSMGGVPPVPTPTKDIRKKRGEVALLHSTDWQLGKQTLTYNTKECERLVKQSIEKTIKIANIQRADHPVKEIVLMLGGDIVENTTIFPAQVYEVDSDIMTQFVEASRILIDIVRILLANFEKVTVVCEPGNHGRIGKFGELPKDIKWGTASTIVRFADRWKSGAYKFFDEVDNITKGFNFRDLYIGHYHQHQSWNMANGEGSVFMSGAVETGNRYARDLLASNGEPSQRLHFVDPEKGRVTSEYRLWLD